MHGPRFRRFNILNPRSLGSKGKAVPLSKAPHKMTITSAFSNNKLFSNNNVELENYETLDIDIHRRLCALYVSTIIGTIPSGALSMLSYVFPAV